jgi:hypothetical protein
VGQAGLHSKTRSQNKTKKQQESHKERVCKEKGTKHWLMRIEKMRREKQLLNLVSWKSPTDMTKPF